MSERWSIATKAAIAESILNLTRLDEIYRTHDNCIKTATLWLALASLCVLDREHVERYFLNDQFVLPWIQLIICSAFIQVIIGSMVKTIRKSTTMFKSRRWHYNSNNSMRNLPIAVC